MSILQLLVQITSILWLIVQLAAAAPPSMVLPNCTEKCGNVSIQYPFGIGDGCYHNEWYEITCNVSVVPNKPFLRKLSLEVLSVDLGNQLVKLNMPIGAANSKCGGVGHSAEWTSTNFKGSPYNFSSDGNQFTVVGCDNALLLYDGMIVAGCTSTCIANSSSVTDSCYGLGCCQTKILTNIDVYKIIISGSTENCTRAFLAEHNWYSTNSFMDAIDLVPVVMDWKPKHYQGFRVYGRTPSYDCFSPSTSGSYTCNCGWAYEGSPFIPNGCRVVEACAGCENSCEFSSVTSGQNSCNRSNTTTQMLGTTLGGGLVLLFLIACVFALFKCIKKRKIMKRKKKFFKRNGGLLLQQQISSNESMVEKSIVFTSLELEKATDNFNQNRILGQGGQGTVYKGMLIDGKIAAIKKSKVVDESQLEQFINEMVILSQINHRNIVKLLGCCLETEVPLLVYEFISNGNLYELIHEQNEEFPLSWKMRLQIATEIAGALSYLHSASYTPIYHRDIKSSNILLDEKFRAKIADFGTSRSIAIEQTHLTTVVQGTFGYLDPEYFQSSQFTEKSDVYSYGVVLVELLTGQKAISSIVTESDKSLAKRFISCQKEMRLFDILDERVVAEAEQEDLITVANIAKRCLSLSGKKRPTMNEVTRELEGIRMSQMPAVSQQSFQENQYVMDLKGPIDNSSQSSIQLTEVYYRRGSTSDDNPLLLS